MKRSIPPLRERSRQEYDNAKERCLECFVKILGE